jgi:hypothetical protein
MSNFINAPERGHFLVYMGNVFIVNDDDAGPCFLPHNWNWINTKDSYASQESTSQ